MVITIEHLKNALTFEEYWQLMRDQVAHGKTSGPNQTEALANYTKLNLKRMERWMKTFQPKHESIEILNAIKDLQYWVVLTETWCGDAAHNIPVMLKLAELNGTIRLRFLFRDENLEIMNAYLTNGTRSIPKLIALNRNLNELFNWGPRPHVIQERFYELKKSGVPHDEYIIEIHNWYNSNAGAETEKEIVGLLNISASA